MHQDIAAKGRDTNYAACKVGDGLAGILHLDELVWCVDFYWRFERRHQKAGGQLGWWGWWLRRVSIGCSEKTYNLLAVAAEREERGRPKDRQKREKPWQAR